MEQRINDLAIILTRKIERDLYHACGDLNGCDREEFVDQIKKCPSTWEIRNTIYLTLERYMNVLCLNVSTAPEVERDLRPDDLKRVREDKIQRQAVMAVKHIMDDDEHFLYRDYSADEFYPLRNEYREIVVLKTGLINKDSE